MKLVVLNLLLFFVDLSVFLSLVRPSVTISSLYKDGEAGIRVLDHTNFTEFLSKNVAFVQYYLSSCGHCQNFKPIFLAGAKLNTNLLKFYTPTVINCNIPGNKDLCSEIDSVPTLICNNPQNSQNKTFDLGPSFNDPEEFVGRVSKCLYSVPKTVKTVLNQNTGSTLELFGGNEEAVFQLVLKYYGLQPIKSEVIEILDADHFNLEKGGNLLLSNVTYSDVVNYINSLPDTFRGSYDLKSNVDYDKNFKPLHGVYAADMITSLYDLFTIDIPFRKAINGDRCKALIEFLNVMADISPFNHFYTDAFKELSTFLQNRQSITAEEWRQALVTYSYPTLRPGFIACKGSAPVYRGYPCGLWVTFHSLTVTEYLKFPGEIPRVPHAMNRLIAYFFSCTECAMHFATISAPVLKKNELIYPANTPPKELALIIESEKKDLPSAPATTKEAILWLNSVHNRVNTRLHGANSEDPMVPKVIFPPVSECSLCYSQRPCANSTSSNCTITPQLPDKVDALFDYLVDYYNPCSYNLDLVGLDLLDSLCNQEQDLGVGWLLWAIPIAIFFTLVCGALLVLFICGFKKRLIAHRHRQWASYDHEAIRISQQQELEECQKFKRHN